VVACTACALGNAVELDAFFTFGRGEYQTVTRTIAESDSPRVTGNHDGVVYTMLEFYSEKLNLPIAYVDNKAFCGSRAAWYVESLEQLTDRPETISVGGPACPTPFRKVAVYPAWGLSGWSWTLYRAEK
jgi:hypothetical protein